MGFNSGFKGLMRIFFLWRIYWSLKKHKTNSCNIIDIIDTVISLAVITCISYLEYSIVIFTPARESIKQIFILENAVYKLFIPASIDMF